jgi:hypothetical protein
MALMSSLWTPSGEHPVDKVPQPSDPTGAADPADPAEPKDPEVDELVAASLPDGVSLEDLSPEERAQAEQMVNEMAEARERLISTPAAVIVANHGMGLYELAALHLAEQNPNLAEATVAIDGLTAIVEKLEGRLGEAEPTLREALDQLRMAFVQVKSRSSAGSTDD